MPQKKSKKTKHLSKSTIAKKLAKLKALILDVDGVLTDDCLYIGADGFELKRFNIADGLSMALALRAGLEIIIMSNRPSEATVTRMKDLGVRHVIQARGNKARLVREYLDNEGIDLDYSECAFMGNDILDIPLAQQVAVGLAVNDAYPDLKDAVAYVTDKKGGYGAVREIIDLYFKGRKLDPMDLLKK